MRLLIYSQDGAGLGHLRRTRNIAEELLAREPRSRVLTITDSPVAPFFRRIRGLSYLALPTIIKTGQNEWSPCSHSCTVEESIAYRSKTIVHVFREFKPDAVLVDHMPVGALAELKPFLDEASEQARPPKLWLSLRDVLDEPSVVRTVWTELGAYDYLERYDAVLVHGTPEIFDASTAYDLASRARCVRFHHYVARQRQRTVTSPATAEPLIVAMGGGGADAFALAKTFLDAVPLLLRQRPLRALIVTGPHMPKVEQAALRAGAAGKPAVVRTSVPDMAPVLRQAAAVVTMAGYNSLTEVLQWRRKALVVPRLGPSSEQRIRSQLFAERGLAQTVSPLELTPARLAEELLLLLSRHDLLDEAHIPPLDGAQLTATRIIEGAAARESAPNHNCGSAERRITKAAAD